ncbi:MAG: hypothetical protein ACR2NB_09070 [Solirubrobacteraceae bacterium]
MSAPTTDRSVGEEAVAAPREASPTRRRRPRPWWAAVLIALFVLGTASDLVVQPRHDALDAVPDTLRALLAALLVFGVTGLGVTRLVLPRTLRGHELLWVLPTGACVTGLALMVLGFCAVPFVVALTAVLLAGAALSVWALRREEAPRLPSVRGELGWPVFLGLAVVAVAVTPMVMELHFAGVTGEGSDAHMAAGAANFLQHAYPTTVDPSLPIDRMPLLWKSKFPIYYAFAAVAQVAGLQTWQAMVPLVGVLLAMAACGMFLVAREVLGARLGVAVAAMGFAGFDRMVLHTGLNPYFNQTWGYTATPFALVLAWWLVRPGETRADRRRAAAMLAIFLGVVAFAYPLAAPIAGLPLVVFLWRERRRRLAAGVPVPRLRNLWRGPRSLIWLVPGAVVLAVPFRGVMEKVSSAGQLALDPSKSLMNWAGDMRSFIPMDHFINLPDEALWRLAIVPIVYLAFRELRRQPRELFYGLGGLLAFGLFEAAIFRKRDFGYYFHFKTLAFVAPLLLVVAAVAAGRIRRWGPYLLAGFAVMTAGAARAELQATGLQLNKDVVELSSWAAALPRDASVRLDMGGGDQLWAAYFLADRRVCSEHPIVNTDYPHVPRSRKADFVVVRAGTPVPADAQGPPLRTSTGFQLYRMYATVPGPDRCSQRQQSRISQREIG